jgi:3-oxoacyl-[acyl-carrier-protein] synthase II
MNRRVVVTGMGCISPLGIETEVVWERMTNGCSGVGPITLFDASTFPVRIAAEVPDWRPEELGADWQRWKNHARQTQFAIAAAIKAGQQAGLADAGVDPLRMGVFLGCGEIFPDFVEFCQATGLALEHDGKDFDLDEFVREMNRVCRADEEQILEPGIAVSQIASLLDAQGPNANFTAACVSSSKAIGEAMESIRRGDTDVMLCGGSHSMIHPFGITGFHRLSTLSQRNETPQQASRPFDLNRDGFVVGEGGVILVLEDLDHARRRGADILAEMTGYGSTHDAFRITDLDPEGRAASRCMTLALADAGLSADEIDYINAHGSGTVVNDKAETFAMKRALGEQASRVAISSTKSMTGHLTTACGAIEMFACVMTLRHGVIPPTINFETRDPLCDLDYTPKTAREMPCRHVMSNSFGFGGQNVTLVASRFMG